MPCIPQGFLTFILSLTVHFENLIFHIYLYSICANNVYKCFYAFCCILSTQVLGLPCPSEGKGPVCSSGNRRGRCKLATSCKGEFTNEGCPASSPIACCLGNVNWVMSCLWCIIRSFYRITSGRLKLVRNTVEWDSVNFACLKFVLVGQS